MSYHHGRTTQVSKRLPPDMRMELINCLVGNQDIFAWSSEDLMGISPEAMEHHLHLLPIIHPVKQKMHYLGPKKDMIIREVHNLLEVGHVKEAHFPTWLSNVVLVPKPSGKWWMCEDFQNLNKVCSKDCHPLLHIDQLVDSTWYTSLSPWWMLISGTIKSRWPKKIKKKSTSS